MKTGNFIWRNAGRAAIAAATLSACSPIEMRSQLDRPPGEAYASAGDVVLRVQRVESLPNIAGKADLFGRTRDRGFIEIRYVGARSDGAPIFRRRDVAIFSNETTMSRTGGISTFHAQGSAFQTGYTGSAQYAAVGTTIIPPTANVGAMPADTIEFALDLQQSRRVTVGQNGIDVIEASPAGVRYRVY